LLAFFFYLDNAYILVAIDEVVREVIVVILCSHLMLVLTQLQSVRMINMCDNISARRYSPDLWLLKMCKIENPKAFRGGGYVTFVVYQPTRF